ncbi:hypothetical protein N7481_012313 [Penicillium waksmanii]|uniref:uncharacterized protein n=1 Tax=Penicillium waksmanii TaxID=69791 RepID=UPI00254939CC|nr:uncharacterized protein N7481_012313 [Penicillium waksmanii]KAJ5965599.1 hypothetical protein N7481_012313 [Penicillium waksmanii]
MRDMRKGEAAEVKWSVDVWWKGGSWPQAQSREAIDGRSGTSLRLQFVILHQPTSHNPLTGQSPAKSLTGGFDLQLGQL